MAVANNTGIVTVREIDWKLVDEGDSIGVNSVKCTLFKKLKKAEWIECMVYSQPNASGKQEWLAVGSHDNSVYLIDTVTYKKTHKLNGHSSFITGLDFSIDNFIRSVLVLTSSSSSKSERRREIQQVPHTPLIPSGQTKPASLAGTFRVSSPLVAMVPISTP